MIIKSLCVIGHGLNMVDHYIKHYSSLGVNSINFVVYNKEEDEVSTFREELETIIDSGNYGVEINVLGEATYRKFDWEEVTRLYNRYKYASTNDWWVIADIDEFHKYDKPLTEIIQYCDQNGHAAVRGGFIDRIHHTGGLVSIPKYDSIWDVFSHGGFFRNPLSGAEMNKITLCKGWVKISNGQHFAEFGGQTTWRWQGWTHPYLAPYNEFFCEVHHFKWDQTSFDRLKEVSDINKRYAFSGEYRLMHEALAKNGQHINLMDPRFMFLELGEQSYKSVDEIKFKHLINRTITL